MGISGKNRKKVFIEKMCLIVIRVDSKAILVHCFWKTTMICGKGKIFVNGTVPVWRKLINLAIFVFAFGSAGSKLKILLSSLELSQIRGRVAG